MTYAALKKKWNWINCAEVLSPASITKTSFCLRYKQYGSGGGGVLGTAVFKNVREAIAWLRFGALPSLLDADGGCDGCNGLPAEKMAAVSAHVDSDQILAFLKLADSALKSEKITAQVVTTICNAYDDLGARTDPMAEIQAQGELNDFIHTPRMLEEFTKEIDAARTNADAEQVSILVALLKGHKFVLANTKHFAILRVALIAMEKSY